MVPTSTPCDHLRRGTSTLARSAALQPTGPRRRGRGLAASSELSRERKVEAQSGDGAAPRPLLDLSLRDQNALLAASGFSPEYTERGLDDPDLDEVRHTLDVVLAAHGHIPAYIIDRGWDLVMANDAAMGMAALAGIDPPLEVALNVMRTCLHPDGIRSRVRDWEQFANGAAAPTRTRDRRPSLRRPTSPICSPKPAPIPASPNCRAARRCRPGAT